MRGGAFFVALALLVSLSPGCLLLCALGGCAHSDQIGPWFAEGLYASVPAEGEHGAYEVRWRGFTSLTTWSPAPNRTIALFVHSASIRPDPGSGQRLQVVNDGGWRLEADYWVGGGDLGRDRFVSALRLVTDASAAQEQELFDRFANSTVVENATTDRFGSPRRPSVPLPNVAGMDRAVGRMVANLSWPVPDSVSFGSNSWILREGPLSVVLGLESRLVSASSGRASWSLRVRADDVAEFHHDSEHVDRPSRAVVSARLNSTLDALGFAGRPPLNVTWQSFHGD